MSDETPQSATFSKEQLLALAKESPHAILKNAALFKGLPFAKKLFLVAAEQEPAFTFSHAHLFDDTDFVSEVLQAAARKAPETAFKFTGWHQSKNLSDACMEAVLSAALEQEYTASFAFEYIRGYVDRSFAQNILEKALPNLQSEDDFKAVFVHSQFYKKKPFAGDILKSVCALPAEAETDPFAATTLGPKKAKAQDIAKHAFDCADFFKDEPYAREVLLAAAHRDSAYTFTKIKNYADQDYAEEVLMVGAKEGNANAFYATSKEYLRQPYGVNVLKVAAENNPADAIKHSTMFLQHPSVSPEVAEEILRKAVAAAPQAIFEHMGFHRNLLEQGYAGDLLEAAAIALPVEAFNNIAEYKDMPYAMRVLTAAAKQNPDAAYRYLENNYGKTPPFANAVKAAADSASRDNEIKL